MCPDKMGRLGGKETGWMGWEREGWRRYSTPPPYSALSLVPDLPREELQHARGVCQCAAESMDGWMVFVPSGC